MTWTLPEPSNAPRWLGGAIILAIVAAGLAAGIGQCGCTPSAPRSTAQDALYIAEGKACVDEAEDAGTGRAGADACRAKVKAKWEAK